MHWSKDPEKKKKVLAKISKNRTGKGLGNQNGFKKNEPSWNKDLPKEQQPRYGKPVSQKQVENMRKVGKQPTKPWNKGKNEYRQIVSKELREYIRKRDKYTCQRCGIHEKELGQQLDIHHIIPWRVFGDCSAHFDDNLICLCRRCHVKMEKKENGTN